MNQKLLYSDGNYHHLLALGCCISEVIGAQKIGSLTHLEQENGTYLNKCSDITNELSGVGSVSC